MSEAVTFGSRRIGGFTAQVTVEEQHSDELQITEHPVERGPMISDHAIKLPARVSIRCGWSNSSREAGGDPGYVDSVYRKLLALQASREPFSITTGRRRYADMLMQSLGVTTDERTAQTLMVSASFRQVIIVETRATTVPPRDVHADPSQTAPVENQGTKQLGPPSDGGGMPEVTDDIIAPEPVG